LKEYIDLLVEHFPFFKDKVFDPMLPASSHSTGPVALTQAVWTSLDKTGQRPAQFGVDFHGYGQYKVYGSEDWLSLSPSQLFEKHMTLGGRAAKG